MMLLKSHLLSVFLASLSFNFDTLYAQTDDELAMMKKMCACASKHNLCNKVCPEIRQALQNKDDEECKDYADQAFGCGGAFSSTEQYKKLCPSLGVPCTTFQNMCACASKHNLCDKKCKALFKIEDPECQAYGVEGICSGFPDKTYVKACPKLNMPCTNSQKMCACANKHKLCGKKCIALFDTDDDECNNYAGKGICGGEFPSDVKYQDHCKTKGVHMKCKKGKCKDKKRWTIKLSYGEEGSCEWVKEDPSERCNDDEGENGKSAMKMCKLSCNTC
eukprot:CAMPEP_0194267896 /NCGR_PEP_ID=MMETSP0169-20130528/2318_1 /TAXON_ID=218684 /ORGANISM="Corethron pennatum, Strain L29A3" /LENGTH=275 /DNA_ID=CAMNT_0039008917 /DNA_START=102 /DNA_END=929 /DNA_ORIENTATION=-